ncbi:MAG: tetratricopeptide repeat protein, partial [Deltaproteobacteria bacterium]|nr:tetratricopeptide repeat protein [Deltaproteobacteria bacterium]
LKRYPSTESGRLALIYAGRCLSRMGRYGEAIQKYQKFLSKDGGKPLCRCLALEGLGYAYLHEKKYEEALASFKELGGLDQCFLGGESILGLARTYEGMGRDKEALKAYKDFLSRYPDAAESDLIKRRVALLEEKLR